MLSGIVKKPNALRSDNIKGTVELNGTLVIQSKPNIRLQPVCKNTCLKAHDGVCDEGRAAAFAPVSIPSSTDSVKAVEVLCDLGTDCADCGAWSGHLPKWDGPMEGPIAFVRSMMNASVLVKLTTTQPSYFQPITNKEKDPDVSAMLENYGALEGGVTRVVHEILGDGQCHRKDGSRGLVLDVGANFGYFTLMAAMYGCRVIAWEPVPLFRAYLHHGIALNNLTHLVTLRNAAISDNSSRVNVGIPKDGTYWGLASVNNLNLMANEVKSIVSADVENLDKIVLDSVEPLVLLLKVDVEGYEPQVLNSASEILRSRTQNILLEYSPGIFERSRDFEGLSQLPSSLSRLLKDGFVAGHLPMRVATPWPPKLMPDHYHDPVPVLEEITLSSLELDLKSAKMRRTTEGGSPDHPLPSTSEGYKCTAIPEELKKFPVWAHCGEWAYAAHPKGFRSSFGFNTNIWLSRKYMRVSNDLLIPAGVFVAASAKRSSVHNRTAGVAASGTLVVAGQASLFAQDQDMKMWTSLSNPGQSIGFMECKGLGPSHQVMFRCPCTHMEHCGEQEKVVGQLLKEGRMPMQDWR
ncbi:hypothetical protein CEUSTIGMA_g9701.t1 [Chlamydomonas eustigma]|uniref:Methyltransferase FkbM domain-containing protein n=1 Tax=Chlamydomonas eustigma TaxID=1157962 RepID=A0A250XH74_9CHLO|nr:hypothetical protein CEUSTIGMA_g9701.t1 [Chlamydomonas eustigma]|eukprot:GAX82272.1 hypothetical protein CEUSTIGMA_g9701.t1 [Chlamydomonas eustigma]